MVYAGMHKKPFHAGTSTAMGLFPGPPAPFRATDGIVFSAKPSLNRSRMDTQKTIDDLNFLIAVNADRIEQFQTAKDEAHSTKLRQLFQRIALESAGHIAQLTGCIRTQGGEVEQGTTLSGTLHKVWVDVKATLSGHDGTAILGAIRCAEKATLEAYDRILEESHHDLPEPVFELVQQQRRTIVESCQTVERLSAEPAER